MVTTLLKVLIALAVAYAVLLVLAWRFQERMALPGARSALPAPEALGIPHGERISVLASDSVRLFGWYLRPNPMPPEGTRAPGLIWFYGNMETVEGIAPVLQALRPPGYGVLALDYRGYGQSEGKPSEEGVYRDGEAAWQFLIRQPEIDPTKIAVYGRSIGSAVALELATRRPVRAVVLDSPFTTGRAMARQHYPIFPSALVRMSLDNLGRAAQLTQPLLVFHGTEDRIAPIVMGRAVAQAGRAKTLVEIPGAGHNDTYLVGGDKYRSGMIEFLTTTVGMVDTGGRDR